jgi:hypothetical protein
MNPQEALQNVWRELVQRRLLPVALLLVGALVAVPFLLSKDPAPAPASPAAATASTAKQSGSELEDPVVSLVADGTPAKRRRVLGYSKNPFQPAAAPKVKAAATPAAGSTTGTAVTGADTTQGDSTSPATGAPGGSAAPVAPTPGTDEPARRYELYSLTVRFGPSDSDALEKMNLPRLKALPSSKDPLLVYLGPGKGGKSAVFMVDASLEPQGDGTCDPRPGNCETIELREGETEFFDVLDETGKTSAQFQLDLVDIKRTTTASSAKAKQARAKASKTGRSALRAHQSVSGPLRYRYDTTSGTVQKLSKRTYKALLAKSARIALGTAGGF